jgi:hypothetical protein
MSFIDFIPNRATTIRMGGRVFVARPITVLGMLEAQRIIARIPTESEAVRDAYLEVQVAAAGKDDAKAAAAVAKLYMAILDGITPQGLAELAALICDPSDVLTLKEAFERGGTEALREFFEAVGSLHDLSRLMRRFSPKESEIVPTYIADADGIGIETAIIRVCHYLPCYRIEDVLNWPYERLISAGEQIRLLESLAAGIAPESQKVASAAELSAAGVPIQKAPSVN